MLTDGDIPTARALLAQGALLLDVRSPQEYAAGHLTGALNVPHDAVAAYVPELLALTGGDYSVPIVVYCVFGKRGANAQAALWDLGFPNVLNIGGLDGLLGRPLVR